MDKPQALPSGNSSLWGHPRQKRQGSDSGHEGSYRLGTKLATEDCRALGPPTELRIKRETDSRREVEEPVRVMEHPRWLSMEKKTPAGQEPQETQVQPLGQEDPLKAGTATHASILGILENPMDREARWATVK